MNKSIELPQLTIKALQDGASIMIVPCKVECMALKGDIPCALTLEQKAVPLIEFAPLQPQDKDVFVKEEFQDNGYTGLIYKTDIAQDCFLDKDWQPASQMTKEQSRFNIGIEDVRVVRVQDIDFDTKQDIFPYQRIIQCYDEEQFANDDFIDKFNSLIQGYEDKHFTETGERISLGNYEDNPYVFLYDVKVTTKEFHKGTKDK